MKELTIIKNARVAENCRTTHTLKAGTTIEFDDSFADGLVKGGYALPLLMNAEEEVVEKKAIESEEVENKAIESSQIENKSFVTKKRRGRPRK